MKYALTHHLILLYHFLASYTFSWEQLSQYKELINHWWDYQFITCLSAWELEEGEGFASLLITVFWGPVTRPYTVSVQYIFAEWMGEWMTQQMNTYRSLLPRVHSWTHKIILTAENKQYLREVELSEMKIGCRVMTLFLLLCFPTVINAKGLSIMMKAGNLLGKC